MKAKKNRVITVLVAFLFLGNVFAQDDSSKKKIPSGGALLKYELEGTDTVFIANFHDIYVFPRQQFKRQSEQQFYWRTVRDVKVALPLAKIVGDELMKTNSYLATLPDDKARKEYLSQYEKDLVAQYEPMIRKMTMGQGKILLKLIYRESQQNSYELIKIYRGGFSAFLWQSVARLFGANLKVEYDPENEDKVLEQIIRLVEAGQL